MKELSIEEKAKRYDEAIELAKEINNEQRAQPFNVMTKVFPELKENEDENIRKDIVAAVETYGDFTQGRKEEIYTWLEKQGEKKLTEKYNIRGIKSKHAEGKLGEMIKEMKSTNKVEPKFHEGEWITNGDYTWKIVEVKPLDYILQSQEGNIVDDTISHVDEQFNSFTIKDAKDGDVLMWDNGRYIILFKEIKDNIVAHCSYNTHSKHFGFSSNYDTRFDCILNFRPATKEQRDTLMKAMTDAGYTFDFNKKELKKAEQKTAWSEEDKKMFVNIKACLRNANKDYSAELDWLLKQL